MTTRVFGSGLPAPVFASNICPSISSVKSSGKANQYYHEITCYLGCLKIIFLSHMAVFLLIQAMGKCVCVGGGDTCLQLNRHFYSNSLNIT